MAHATANSTPGRRPRRPLPRALLALGLAVGLSLLPTGSWGADASDVLSTNQASLVRWANTRHNEAQVCLAAQPTNAQAAWQLGRACFDLAEFATTKRERSALAEQGVAASRQAIALASNSAPGHYYLAMNLGQLARSRTFGALRLVDQMEREFSLASSLDEHFDHAGADRALSLLYRDAPSLGSIGSRPKARQHLARILALDPDFPENRLTAIESYLKWGEKPQALAQLRLLEARLPQDRASLTGPDWAASWADWDQRLAKVQKKLSKLTDPDKD